MFNMLPCKAWSIVVELCLRFRTEAGGIIILVGILRFGFVIRVLCFWTFPGFMTSLYCLTSPWLPYKRTPGRLKSKITRSPSAISLAMSMLSRTLLSKSLELKNFIDQVLFECKKYHQETLVPCIRRNGNQNKQCVTKLSKSEITFFTISHDFFAFLWLLLKITSVN